jgi:hypothetical protein
MTAPPGLEVVDDLAVLKFHGEHALQGSVRRITEALIYARERQIPKLLIHALEATTVGKATVSGVFFQVQEWARAADGMVRVAFVLPPQMIDPKRFGVTVAANSGLMGEVFGSEDEALRWLHRAPSASRVRQE